MFIRNIQVCQCYVFVKQCPIKYVGPLTISRVAYIQYIMHRPVNDCGLTISVSVEAKTMASIIIIALACTFLNY